MSRAVLRPLLETESAESLDNRVDQCVKPGLAALRITVKSYQAQFVKQALSPKTVSNHISNIFNKLQVADRAQAIVRARQAGLGREG